MFLDFDYHGSPRNRAQSVLGSTGEPVKMLWLQNLPQEIIDQIISHLNPQEVKKQLRLHLLLFRDWKRSIENFLRQEIVIADDELRILESQPLELPSWVKTTTRSVTAIIDPAVASGESLPESLDRRRRLARTCHNAVALRGLEELQKLISVDLRLHSDSGDSKADLGRSKDGTNLLFYESFQTIPKLLRDSPASLTSVKLDITGCAARGASRHLSRNHYCEAINGFIVESRTLKEIQLRLPAYCRQLFATEKCKDAMLPIKNFVLNISRFDCGKALC